MGELRSGTEAGKGGVWARYYRGELSADSNYDSSFSQDYTGFQGGIDKVQDYKGGKLIQVSRQPHRQQRRLYGRQR